MTPETLPERIIACGPQYTTRPWLSVLTPFHGHDPTPLLQRLATQCGDEAEVILLDDGSASVDLLLRALGAASRLRLSVRIVVWPTNRGRAAARNRLIAEARGVYVLFLDADMIPDAPDFLSRWLDLIDTQQPAIAFGGLSLRQAPRTADTALHHFVFAHSDCRSVARRERDPAQFTAASNLLVRQDVLTQTPFDNDFTGWGWEDVDWALRAADIAPITHFDNPATHAGLDSADTLLRKAREAGPNYRRLLAKRPEAKRFASWRIARALQLLPLRDKVRAALAWLVRDPACCTPLFARHGAYKLYRSLIYAEAIA